MMMSWLYYLILIQLLVISWIDLKKKKISNFWAIGNLLLALTIYLFMPATYPFTWEVLLFPMGFIGGGFLLFLLGVMGAGDSKYLASLFMLIPLEHHAIYFEKLLTATITVGALLLMQKLIVNFSKVRAYLFAYYWQGLKVAIKSKFSYAPVILLAWILLRFQV